MYACNIHPHSSHINDCEPFPIRKILLATNDPDHLQKNNCCTFHSFCKRPAHPDGMDYLQTQLLYLPSFFFKRPALPVLMTWIMCKKKNNCCTFHSFFKRPAHPDDINYLQKDASTSCGHQLFSNTIIVPSILFANGRPIPMTWLFANKIVVLRHPLWRPISTILITYK